MVTVLTEIKNVRYQSLTGPLRDYPQFAQTTGRRFDLFVRSDTSLSRPLQNLVDSGQINRCTIPGT
jgi:hypothetical protein